MPETSAAAAPQPAPEIDPQQAGIAGGDCRPALSSRRNILNFMACVAEGVLLEAIPEATGRRLIYAARAALAARPANQIHREKPKNTPPYPRGNSKVNRVFSILNSSK
jgi:hypothetical protein